MFSVKKRQQFSVFNHNSFFETFFALGMTKKGNPNKFKLFHQNFINYTFLVLQSMTVIGTKSRGSVKRGWEMSPYRNECTKK